MPGLFGDPWTPHRVVEPNLLRVPTNIVTETQSWSSGGSSPEFGEREWMFSITDMPLATPGERLLRIRLKRDINLQATGPGAADAGVAATSPSALVVKKNGAANGTITFTGTSGAISLTTPSYADGDLFELYAPATIDATLDDLSITFETN